MVYIIFWPVSKIFGVFVSRIILLKTDFFVYLILFILHLMNDLLKETTSTSILNPHVVTF